jgi:hypothetical protein
MRQQRLDWRFPGRSDSDAWVRHAGVEAATNRLALWLVHGGRLWLTSDEVAGKSHLLSLLAAEHASLGLITVGADHAGQALQWVRRWLVPLEPKAFWAVDVEAGALSQAQALALFHLLERARDMRRPMLIAWRDPGPMPPELESRLKGMERVEMLAPHADVELRRIMRAVATSLQWEIPDAVLDTLLVRLPRRLDALPQMLRSLEADSLHQGKRLTPVWVRRWLEQAERP